MAWHPLGWSPAWFAEIEPFPSAVLAHRFPEVPNLGDMTTIAARIAAGEVEAPDVLVGGTPCQAFSVAGLRGGLSDARGQLTLSYVDLANVIDSTRAVRGQQPAVVVWENVPGVLSSKDNAFGCFLGALVGEDCALVPPGRRWSNAGCVFGPQRAAAWRILDAQYFGVAQRRRRVFVVASARDGFDPTEILFEFEGMRRDSPPSREAGEGFAADVAPSLVSSGRGVERIGETRGQDPVVAVPPAGCWWDGGQVSQTLDAVLAKGQTMPEKNRFPAVLQPVVPLLEVGKRTGVSTTDRRAGSGIGEDGDPMFTLQAGAQHGVIAIQNATRGKSQNGLGVASPGDPMYTLDQGSQHAIAFSCKDYGADAGPISPTLRAMGHSGSHANAGGQVAVAFDSRQDPVSSEHVFGALGSSSPQAQAVCITGGITHTLKAEGFDASEDGTGRGQPIVAAFAENSRADLRYEVNMAVRRLTPVECERLQGFPDNWTLIPQKKLNRLVADEMAYLRTHFPDMPDDEAHRLSADGPRYKALGNSMAVPCMFWIGARIDTALRADV